MITKKINNWISKINYLGRFLVSLVNSLIINNNNLLLFDLLFNTIVIN